ncbi:MAG: patatin-like phospholipase family protein [Deltaproteobacteria bacterium]|nr:patatin-like phospholipase family protein [Deltaproteobacteria bacterium]
MQEPRIGLALSGGGFRASIFHLGVILRLEELGIMPRVDVISAVSGGSIVSAYYVVEMERRLGEGREEIREGRPLSEVRVEIFRDIARDFFKATDHNLRSRALVFFPFYHPIATLKMLRTRYNRSDAMQAEYDRWFYRGESLDQLPSPENRHKGEPCSYLFGPKLILNTTSLLTGRRVGYSREPISGLNELSTINTNVLPLSRIVGASAGVPVLFPPTFVSGDMLVDGGVTDNQGLEALWQEEKDRAFDVLLVSDASGQMELIHRMSSSGMKTLSRTNTIFQFQSRKKVLDRLVRWRNEERDRRRFAFVHLHLNLKDRSKVRCRVPSEYIPAIARIRTDLDQFSFVEREALMYHGYTLMDGQLKKYCPDLIEDSKRLVASEGVVDRPAVAPLFRKRESDRDEKAMIEKREEMKRILGAGSRSVFLARAAKRHGAKAIAWVALTWALPLLLFFVFIYGSVKTFAEQVVEKMLGGWLSSAVPGWLADLWPRLKEYIASPLTLQGLTILAAFTVLAYMLAFITYVVMRSFVRRWDLAAYRRLAGAAEPDVVWSEDDHGESGKRGKKEEEKEKIL